MQCDNCGYIFFQPSKKCACCSAPYTPAQSAFDVGQENLFTIFEMAAGEGGIPGMGMAGAHAGVGDYNFTDDFDTGETEYGVDENVLDLSDAEAEGFGIGAATGAMGVDDFEFDTSMGSTPSMENAGADNFDLNLPADSTETMETEFSAEADDTMDLDFSGGFDEVEGLGFGPDESPAEEAQEGETAEISLDTDLEPEISLEPELDIDDEEPSLELSEDSGLDIEDDEQPSLELPEDLDLSEEPELMDASEEEPSLELPGDLDLTEEPELMDTDMEDEGGIEFDLDGVDLEEPEEVTYEVPETDTGDEEPSMDFEGLELEMETPDEPEDEDLKQ